MFAYIARTWAGAGDRLTAASGQLATWIYAGMSDADARGHAARAGADADAVYERAGRMLAEARVQASTGVHAAAIVELAESGPGRVRVELTVDRVSGPEVLPPGAHPVAVTLTGAAFDDGTTQRSVPSGTDIPITPTGTAASTTVSAAATTDGLPYGNRLTVALPTVDAQAVLIAQPSSASAQAQTEATGPSPLPFQPRVETQTTAAQAHPGAEVADRLTVTVEEGDGLLPSWGVRAAGDGFEPVEAVVESTLYGPFSDAIAEAEKPPVGAPTVCTVETAIHDTGEYVTPPCTVPADGYYVWTDRIDPSRVAVADGGGRLRPWVSRFGVATEITRVSSAPVAVAPVPVAPVPVAPGSTASLATTVVLADTGADVGRDIGPAALSSLGATATGVAMLVMSHMRRDRRKGRAPRFGRARPRRARSTWISL
ncbi:hypothetical protein [Leifsonia sp. 22587]|uniref:hypothetical protein n=1 Tax=Leifsonia sp. 22587 TaxID=3453946 RepID=UPI003F855060